MAKITFSSSGSADRHHVDREDAQYAVRNNRLWVRQFDEPRIDGPRPELFIGPVRDKSVELEVMANFLVTGDLEVFHVMHLREKTIRRIREQRRQQD